MSLPSAAVYTGCAGWMGRAASFATGGSSHPEQAPSSALRKCQFFSDFPVQGCRSGSR